MRAGRLDLGIVLGTWQVTTWSSGILTWGAARRGFPTRAEQAQEPTESFRSLPSAATPKVWARSSKVRMKSQLEAEFTAILHLKFPWGRTFRSGKKIASVYFMKTTWITTFY